MPRIRMRILPLFWLFTLALTFAVTPPRPAFADPTPDQMEAAKKAFLEGKALHDQGKLAEAVEKFKDSYRLSRNPLLLYNIGFTLEELKKPSVAIVFYRKFLTDAPKDASQRAEVTERVKTLENEIAEGDLTSTSPPDTTTKPQPAEPKPPVEHKVKPPGTYKADDFQHQLVAEAPPGKPLDLSAAIPDDSGWAVTMYYRRAGESDFTARPMHLRNKELVARIPAAKMAGSSIQYYIEVKDQTGNVVTRSGKATSPNVVDIEASAPPRFYADFVDDSGPAPTTPTTKEGDENPLGGGTTQAAGSNETPPPTEEGSAGSGGLFDVGSKPFERTKWIASGATVAFVAGTVLFYVEAAKNAKALRDDAGLSTSNGQPCVEPCHTYDSYDANLEAAGQRDQTISRVLLVTSIVGAGVAGYYWYRELTSPKHEKATETSPEAPPHDETSWLVVPTVGDGFTGAAAAVRF